jgi:hypothetical protein
MSHSLAQELAVDAWDVSDALRRGVSFAAADVRDGAPRGERHDLVLMRE